ncbi:MULTISPECIES: hypothetical protein [unclassified Bradyrhizobium]|uniref:DUF7716 domain-containing protein n=1 Tax=unclassified Bradyrhizobium TaxID=2631580 RepID=UPI0028E4CCCD|nr:MULTISPECIES: hypothetical protein [unclassified Bradyrhizobium]
MRLSDAISSLSNLDDNAVIFARKPWTRQSDAYVAPLDHDFRVPETIKKLGLDYFLEVNIAKEVLEVFGERMPTADQVCDLILFYAENDAFPEWVFPSTS